MIGRACLIGRRNISYVAKRVRCSRSTVRVEDYRSNISLTNTSNAKLSTTSDSREGDPIQPSSAVLTTPQPKRRIQDILLNKNQREYTISQSKTVGEAISFLVEKNLSSALVLAEDNSLIGIFTARDILRYIHSHGETYRNGQAKALQSSILQVTTKREKLVYCSPTDSVKRCREIMFQLKIRNIPVLDKGEVLGIVTIKDLADSSFSLIDIGGKKGFIHNVTGRKGIPDGTKISQSNDNIVLPRKPLIKIDFGAYALPHPYKSPEGVASSRRSYGAKALCEDVSLCEGKSCILAFSLMMPDTFNVSIT
jgi:CBS domain-containing protein